MRLKFRVPGIVLITVPKTDLSIFVLFYLTFIPHILILFIIYLSYCSNQLNFEFGFAYVYYLSELHSTVFTV